MWYHFLMSKAEKILEKMRNNPKADWTIQQVRTVAKAYGAVWDRPSGGSSHEIYRSKSGLRVTMVSRKPIKIIYIKLFVEFIDKIKKEQENEQ